MNESTGKALIRTIAVKELGQIAVDSTEIAIDSILSDGIIKDLPVIGKIKSFINIGITIKEELFIRKLLKFLIELQNISFVEREQFLNQYSNNSKEQQKLGDNLLLAIDRLDDVEKPILLARFFCSYIKGDIDCEMFSRLAKALERLNLSLLSHLKWFYLRKGERIDISEEIHHELSLAGLITANISGSGSVGGGAYFAASDIGRAFLKIGYGLSKQ